MEPPIVTNLDRTMQIWNSLIIHRKINCEDGMNIKAEAQHGFEYPAIQMSDGEKVMLYLISQVLQAPINGFIVIDEPEMYLHKSILKKLWDRLEKERQDCLFVYLTHDLEFATSRIAAKKIWIKSYTPPDQWEIEEIPENDIPETLLLELLGSRNNILFCEGDKGKIDERIYSILFPDFTVAPVGSCFDVIHYTKAFNRINNLSTKAFGLIDSDHHGRERLGSLTRHDVYSFDVAEAENLFLDEGFLAILSKQFFSPSKAVESTKIDIVRELGRCKELQVSNYISTKINYYFKDSHVSEGNTLAEVKLNYESFSKGIKIDEWYSERLGELNDIISCSDYKRVISIFNNKGLKKIASKNLEIPNFIDKSIKVLLADPGSREFLYSYFPEEIIKAGNKGRIKN